MRVDLVHLNTYGEASLLQRFCKPLYHVLAQAMASSLLMVSLHLAHTQAVLHVQMVAAAQRAATPWSYSRSAVVSLHGTVIQYHVTGRSPKVLSTTAQHGSLSLRSHIVPCQAGHPSLVGHTVPFAPGSTHVLPSHSGYSPALSILLCSYDTAPLCI